MEYRLSHEGIGSMKIVWSLNGGWSGEKTIYRKYTDQDIQALILLMVQLGSGQYKETLPSSVRAVRASAYCGGG